jgi:Phage tail tube protein
MEVLRYAAFLEETAYGQSASLTPTFAVDQSEASLEADKTTEIVYAGSLGRAPRIHRPGFYSCVGDVTYAFDVRSIGWFLKWALGGYAYTAGTGLHLHELYGTNDVVLPSFVSLLGKDKIDGTNFEHVFAGCTIDSLDIEVGNEYATVKVGIAAAMDAANPAGIRTRAAVQALLPTEHLLVFHNVTAKLGNNDISARTDGLKLQLKNNVKATSGQCIGSRFASRMPAGARETTFTADLYFNTMDEMTIFWGDEQGPAMAVNGTTETSLTLTFASTDDSGAANGTLIISLPRVILSTVPTAVKGKDEIKLNVEGSAFEDSVLLNDNTSVYTDILASLSNNQDEMAIEGS